MIGEIRQNFTEASASVGLILATALESNFLKLSGGTMSGVLAMGNNKISGLPLATQDGDVVDCKFCNRYTPARYRSGSHVFRSNNIALVGAIQTGYDRYSEVATIRWSNNKFLWRGH